MHYSKIVFGLKHHQKLYGCRRFMELVDSLRIIIYEHNAVTDYCERPGLHYHGIIEHDNVNGDDIDAILELKIYCAYFKIEKCNSPEQYIKDMAKFPNKIMINQIWKSAYLSTCYAKTPIAGAINLERGHFENESYKTKDIELIMNKYIIAGGISDAKEIWRRIEKDVYYYWSMPEQLQSLITDSIALAHQKILDQSLLELCGKIITSPDSYYSLEETIDLVMEWCGHQNIDLKEFTVNLVRCFDKQVSFKNTLYIQGAPETGVFSIINSITEACRIIGKIDNDTTGYAYVWEDCFDKRCIIMRDPVFDENMFETLEHILQGIGTFVPHRQSTLKYVRRTPVILTCSESNWESYPYLKRLQKSFIASYEKLKPFLRLHSNPRRLHPDWIYVMYTQFTGNPNDTLLSYREDIIESPMAIDSSLESSDEEYSSAASVSSSTSVSSGQ